MISLQGIAENGLGLIKKIIQNFFLILLNFLYVPTAQLSNFK